jgi:hypothetical protein
MGSKQSRSAPNIRGSELREKNTVSIRYIKIGRQRLLRKRKDKAIYFFWNRHINGSKLAIKSLMRNL